MAKALDGQKLLVLFGALMIIVGITMLRSRSTAGNPEVRLSMTTARELLPLLLGIGFAVGLLSGFFGIGGGFLIVPGLMLGDRDAPDDGDRHLSRCRRSIRGSNCSELCNLRNDRLADCPACSFSAAWLAASPVWRSEKRSQQGSGHSI